MSGRTISDWEMVLGDSRTELKKISEQSVDMICTDPPYNLAKYSTGNIKLDWRADFNNDLAPWDLEDFDPKDWLDEFCRVLSPTGNVFAFTSYNLLGRWHEVFDPVFDISIHGVAQDEPCAKVSEGWLSEQL